MRGVWGMAMGAADGWRTPLLVLILALWLGTWIAAMVDIVRRPADRWRWGFVVTLFPLIGFLVYWLLGERHTTK